jgi:CubicO group peptidase (beta-lactamase class C family)
VKAAFADVVREGTGTGASLAVWHGGSWVVDLWGGYADAARTMPWRADTIVMPYSVTKPFAAMGALVLADRGRIDLDAPLAQYWPEMTAVTTLRQVLAHASGHVVLDRPAPETAFYDWDEMCRRLAEQEPSWEAGTAIGESALVYGRPLGRFLADEVCGPLGLDFHIGLTDAELARVADLTGFGAAFQRGHAAGGDLYHRALANPPGALDPLVVNCERWRRAEVPAVNGHGTARAVAGLYVALQEGRLLSPTMLAAATSAAASGTDRVMGDERAWGLGFVLDADGYGMGGLGGSLGWWSATGEYAFGFVTGEIAGFDRAERLDDAVRACCEGA